MMDITSPPADTEAFPTTTSTATTALSADEMHARVYPSPANPYTFDLGHLLVSDTNPIPPNSSEQALREIARSSAQALVNQLLSTCPITNSGDNGAPAMSLPTGQMAIPREKPVPDQTEKTLTKWEAFAKRRGIQKKRRDARPNMEFDEGTGEWAPKWGFGGKNMRDREAAWLEELDENGEKKGKKTGKAGSKK